MKLIHMSISYLLIALGALLLVSPFPGTLLLLFAGFSLLIGSSTVAAGHIRSQRSKSLKLNYAMSWVENRMGKRMSRTLRKTRLN